MKLLKFLKSAHACMPVHCALSRCEEDPCFLQRKYPEEHSFAVENGYLVPVITLHPHMRNSVGYQDICWVLSKEGRSFYRQLKGDFT